MKQDLAELGYAEDDVKKQTPLQASLILQHQVPPQECETRLPVLVSEYEKEQEREQEEAAAAAVAAMEQSTAQPKAAAQQQFVNTTPPPPSNIITAYSSRDLLLYPHLAEQQSFFSKPRLWFELVQSSDTANADVAAAEEIVGLYASEQEAEDGLETHQYFAQRHNKNNDKMESATTSVVSFEIRKVYR